MNSEPSSTLPSHATHVGRFPTLSSERMFSSTSVTVPALAVQFLKLDFEQTSTPGDQALALSSQLFQVSLLRLVSLCKILKRTPQETHGVTRANTWVSEHEWSNRIRCVTQGRLQYLPVHERPDTKDCPAGAHTSIKST